MKYISSLSKLRIATLLCTVSLLSVPFNQVAAAPGKRAAAEDNTEGEYANFAQWKNATDFIDRMVNQHGFDRDDLERTFRRIHYVNAAVQYIKPAPIGQPKNWAAYRERFVEPIRIKAGVAFWNKYQSSLERAEAQYGVPAEIIVGLIGVETIYGKSVGNFRVIDAITTLAFAYPETLNRDARMTYFQQELETLLLLARDQHFDPFSLRGSYAGAMGWPQFMPSSLRDYGVDFDGDGKIDLARSPVDAIGSVANYLAQHGWHKGDPTVFPVQVTPPANDNPPRDWQRYINQGLLAQFSIDELRDSGVAITISAPSDLKYGLVDLQNGGEPTEYWLATNNFFAITQYNRSYFYAMAVIDLAKAIRTARSN